MTSFAINCALLQGEREVNLLKGAKPLLILLLFINPHPPIGVFAQAV